MTNDDSSQDFVLNGFETSTVLIDQIMPRLAPAAFMVLMYAFRHRRPLSLEAFETGCGLDRSVIEDALPQLESEGLMARIDGEQGPRWVFMVSDGGEA